MQTKNDTSKPEDSPQQAGEGCSGATCSVSYLEGALAKAKTWSVHNSPYAAHHLPEHQEWLRGYADYPQKFSSPNTFYGDRMRDAHISTDHLEWLRFRTFGGGGMSLRTRTALLILAEAIRLDNEEKPQTCPTK